MHTVAGDVEKDKRVGLDRKNGPERLVVQIKRLVPGSRCRIWAESGPAVADYGTPAIDVERTSPIAAS